MGNKHSGNKKRKPSKKVLEQIRQNTSFSDREIMQLYSSFMKHCPSGQMKERQFEQMYRDFYKQSDAANFARHVFRTFDRNDDKSIDFREFICSVSVLCHGTKREKLRWAFSLSDVDDSGCISEDELRDVIKSIFDMMSVERRQQFLDDNETPEYVASRLFVQMDENGDGTVTLDEFLAAASDDAVILKLLGI